MVSSNHRVFKRSFLRIGCTQVDAVIGVRRVWQVHLTLTLFGQLIDYTYFVVTQGGDWGHVVCSHDQLRPLQSHSTVSDYAPHGYRVWWQICQGLAHKYATVSFKHRL